MFADQFALLALSSLALVSAQANSNSTFTIDPELVEPLQRSTWCNAQQDSCRTLCGTPIVNDCISKTLDFVCECLGNSFPDMNEYKNTIPWFVCDKLQKDCTVQNEGNAAGQRNCTKTYEDKCGTEDVNDHAGEGAAKPTTSATTTTSAPESTTPTTPETTSSSGAAAAPTAHLQHLGNGAAAVALGLLAYAL